MLATSSFFRSWQFPLLISFLGIWVFGGGTLLWVGWRFVAKAPKATYWRSIGTNVLASCAGACAWLLAGLAVAATGGAALIPLVGLAAGLPVIWLVIMAMFRISYRKAILAWLPTLGASVLAAPLLVLILMPGLGRARELARRARCMTNLSGIGKGIGIYVNTADNDQWPPDLETLIRQGQPADMFRCPSGHPGRRFGYFYLQPEQESDGKTIIACDLRGNHGGEVRNYLNASMSVMPATEAEFQILLTHPRNAKFAAALRKVEGPWPGRRSP